MPYTVKPSRANPGCFLFLIDQSGSMDEPFGGDKSRRKADGVADAVNRMLQNLVLKCTKSEGVRDYFHVGVISYGSKVSFAYSGALSGERLVPISKVAQGQARLEERTRRVYDDAGDVTHQPVKFPVWFEPRAEGGTPMCEAINVAFTLLQEWLPQHPHSFPPIVINITDGQSTDGDPTLHALAIANLTTSDGAALLFNCHISPFAASPIMFPESEAGLADEYAQLLFRMSSILPDPLREAARNEGYIIGERGRGFAFNADLVELISFLVVGTQLPLSDAR